MPAHISSPQLPRADCGHAAVPGSIAPTLEGQSQGGWLPEVQAERRPRSELGEQRIAEDPPAQWAGSKVNFPRTQARAQPPAQQPQIISRGGGDDSAMRSPQLPLLGLLRSVGAGKGLTAHLVLWFPRWAPWGTPCMLSTPASRQRPGL